MGSSSVPPKPSPAFEDVLETASWSRIVIGVPSGILLTPGTRERLGEMPLDPSAWRKGASWEGSVLAIWSSGTPVALSHPSDRAIIRIKPAICAARNRFTMIWLRARGRPPYRLKTQDL